MLFNLSRQLHFTSTGKGDEIYCRSDYGPCYGDIELEAFEPFNGYGRCRSMANYDTFKIEYTDRKFDKNMLTNEGNGQFTITELEVWSIKEVVRNNKFLIDIGRMNTLREKENDTENECQREKRERQKQQRKGTET
jgi:hypothetical protein